MHRSSNSACQSHDFVGLTHGDSSAEVRQAKVDWLHLAGPVHSDTFRNTELGKLLPASGSATDSLIHLSQITSVFPSVKWGEKEGAELQWRLFTPCL